MSGAPRLMACTLVALFGGAIDLSFDPFSDLLALACAGNSIVLARPGAATLPIIEPDMLVVANPPSVFDTDYFVIAGLSDQLRIHSEPDVSSPVVGRKPSGTLLRNKGCKKGDAYDWCNVVFVDASGTEAWAATDYPEPAAAIMRASEGLFDEIGTLYCAEDPAARLAKCDFGLTRDADGKTVVTVFRGDGTKRFLTFANGAFAFADMGKKQGGLVATTNRDQTTTIMAVGDERYTIRQSLLDAK